jgi:hypothetical protein
MLKRRKCFADARRVRLPLSGHCFRAKRRQQISDSAVWGYLPGSACVLRSSGKASFCHRPTSGRNSRRGRKSMRRLAPLVTDRMVRNCHRRHWIRTPSNVPDFMDCNSRPAKRTRIGARSSTTAGPPEASPRSCLPSARPLRASRSTKSSSTYEALLGPRLASWRVEPASAHSDRESVSRRRVGCEQFGKCSRQPGRYQ